VQPLLNADWDEEEWDDADMPVTTAIAILAAGALTSQKIAIAKRRFKDQRKGSPGRVVQKIEYLAGARSSAGYWRPGKAVTVAEFRSWEESIDQYGLGGLRTTRIQRYRPGHRRRAWWQE
jgi:hypothetical protein